MTPQVKQPLCTLCSTVVDYPCRLCGRWICRDCTAYNETDGTCEHARYTRPPSDPDWSNITYPTIASEPAISVVDGRQLPNGDILLVERIDTPDTHGWRLRVLPQQDGVPWEGEQ